MHFTVLQVVATLVAFLAQFSRIFAATKPFWSKLPAVVQVWLPPIVPFVAALQAQLSGVATWTDFTVALVVSAALLLPGAPSNRSAAPLQAAKPFVPPNYPMGPMGGMFLLCLVMLSSGCALLKGPVTPKSIDTAAVILCDSFFSAQKPGMSAEDIEKAFCSAARDIEPFLLAAKRAQEQGGAVALHRSESAQ